MAPSPPRAGKAFGKRYRLTVAEDVQAGEQVGAASAAHGKLTLPEAHRVAVEHRDGVQVHRIALVDTAKAVRGKLRKHRGEAKGHRQVLAVTEVEVAVTPAGMKPEEIVVKGFPVIVVMADKDAAKAVDGSRAGKRREIPRRQISSIFIHGHSFFYIAVR